jgi:adenosylmethionine-8-amino-7-oxononanoate aminotransferase
VLLILDEVMCGMGRTGHLFACSEDEVVPDILTIGKGLAAGYQPISAMLVRAHIHEAIASGSGMLRNGQTFAFHATACATALAVQQILEQENLLANVQLRGEQLRALLRDTFAEHPNVGDIRGRGLFVGVELVADRLTKQPLPFSHNIASKIRPLAMQAGMMTYPLGGTIDGKNGDHVLFAPPFIVTESEIEQMVTIFSGVLNTALG